MSVKYGLEASLVRVATGRTLGPLEFVSPLLSVRSAAYAGAPTRLLPTLGLLALPFLWIGLSMSVRRAADASRAPALGLLFAVPIVNFPLMLWLASLPRSERAHWGEEVATRDDAHTGRSDPSGVVAALSGVGTAIVIAVPAVAAFARGLASYGTVLFFVTPLFMGAVSALVYNRGTSRTLSATIGVAIVGGLASGAALLLFALEGAVCLVMAAPIGFGALTIGAIVGHAIAKSGGAAGRAVMLGVLPVFPVLALEAHPPSLPLYEVRSSVDIEAPPEVVFRHVIDFPPLPDPKEWWFRTGIAFPMRAHIIGRGVGATRYCEFSTGAFVEPITHWEPGVRLSFDVTAEPSPMQEWSIYGRIHPPHLDGALHSRRGEFRLLRLSDNRTRLEGSTWYELSMAPAAYWKAWSDLVIHGIHQRVLAHVRALSEAEYSR